MPRFYPSLTNTKQHTPRSERKVLSILEQVLPDEFSVFHSVEFLENKAYAREGEADLVILHPKLGFLVLEVKGGGISLESGQWYSENRQGKYSIKNPFTQARRAKHVFLQRISDKLGLNNVIAGYGVCFPDCTLPSSTDLPPECERVMVLDAHVLKDNILCLRHLEKLFRHWAGSRELTPNESKLIRSRVLAPMFRLVPDQALSIQDREECLVRLTEQQFQLLDFLQQHQEAVIQGGAGTGKTLLLVEKARRLSHEGKQTLVLCFNTKLATQLTQLTASFAGVRVFSFHELCNWAAQQAHLEYLPSTSTPEDFYRDQAPELLMEAISLAGLQHFDAILVDEAQDFEAHWWLPIEELRKSESIFYLFYDPQQTLFTDDVQLPLVCPPVVLSENCRNTFNIASWLRIQNEHAASPKQGLPTGVPPVTQRWNTYQEQKDQVIETLDKLLAEGITAHQIVLLTPYNPQRSQLKELTEVPRYQGIQLESIMAYKGLEAPVILLCDLGDNAFARRQDLLYTGASRARQMLYLFCHHNYHLK
ncbi:MAG: NERD domain-containing protein/DEAD/DEAH box helicase [Oceanospirillaceae bacterium]|nr:NERD domain-containing protein/DEAD/DEAH box helicase [Oceanospirillaceae bacterium]